MNPTTTEIQSPTKALSHVRHSLEFKHQVVAACNQADTSTAAIARAYGINANMLRRWVAQSSQGTQPEPEPELTQAAPPSAPAPTKATFIALKLAPAPPAQATDIRIEFPHARGAIQIQWPMAASNQCAQWLREVLA